jgi:CRP-like cAMP-binding protein
MAFVLAHVCKNNEMIMEAVLKPAIPVGIKNDWNYHPITRNNKEKTDQGADGALCALIRHITNYTGMEISLCERNQLLQGVKIKTLRRRQYLLQEGDICKSASFVIKGALRMFSVNERGQEAILSFGLENCWVSDKESLSLQSPSQYNIEALEQTLVLQFNATQLDILQKTIPAFANLMKMLDREQAIVTQKRIHAAISMNAEERYHDFLLTHPNYAQRFSQNMIAAYLGIKPETLSRVRKR